jgi:hypothetical protein
VALKNTRLSTGAIRAVIAAVLTSGLVVGSLPANAQSHGVIVGTVVNGTVGGSIPIGDEVTLVGRRGTDPLPLTTSVVDADGTFTFTDLPTGPNVGSLGEITPAGTSYTTDSISLQKPGEFTTTLTVYESTSHDPGISFMTVSRLLQHETADAISVLDVVEIFTPGDRSFLPSTSSTTPPPLRFAVPEGAFALQPISGFSPEELVIGGPGFAVMAPLQPGITTIVYTYQLRLIGGGVAFDWLIGLPATTVRLLGEHAQLEITPQGLTTQVSESFGEMAFDVWETHEVAARTAFAISVTDTSLPDIARAIRATTANQWALFAAGGGVLISLALATRHRIWSPRPPLEDFARARQLLEELQQTSDQNSTAHSLLREELVDLIERRPTIAGELRRDQSAGDGSPTV